MDFWLPSDGKSCSDSEMHDKREREKKEREIERELDNMFKHIQTHPDLIGSVRMAEFKRGKQKLLRRPDNAPSP